MTLTKHDLIKWIAMQNKLNIAHLVINKMVRLALLELVGEKKLDKLEQEAKQMIGHEITSHIDERRPNDVWEQFFKLE